MTRQESVKNVLIELDKHRLENKLEILANVFLEIGIQNINDVPNKDITTSNVYELVLNDIDENGENLANAIARQGLLILTWLNKEIK